MPYALVLIGLVMVITGILNTYAALGAQLRKDFTGSQNFVVWILALGSIGALGYVKSLRQFSHYFMALVLISLILANRGFFQKFSQAIAQGPVAPTAGASSDAPGFTINLQGATDAVKSALGVSTSASIPEIAGKAATGDNPGSSAIGSITAPFANATRKFFGMTPLEGMK